MAPLASLAPPPTAPTLERVPGEPDGSTAADIVRARELSEAATAAGAKWAFADWLLERLPMVGRGHRNGSIARLTELGDAIDASPQYLHHLRRASYSWPPSTRLEPPQSGRCTPSTRCEERPRAGRTKPTPRTSVAGKRPSGRDRTTPAHGSPR